MYIDVFVYRCQCLIACCNSIYSHARTSCVINMQLFRSTMHAGPHMAEDKLTRILTWITTIMDAAGCLWTRSVGISLLGYLCMYICNAPRHGKFVRWAKLGQTGYPCIYAIKMYVCMHACEIETIHTCIVHSLPYILIVSNLLKYRYIYV